ncbi:GntR family transcriptional regulator [Solwaraspora sp. WMMA2080]|uniref:GntR family transcriptional regulator n=1 Tax=unclassified Solwaraspora TaxID=2627926 RepID=UPI00248CD989|nr:MULTISPECIES: GntR family transcriptional regulator [unclassified Solwaraspora]WBB95225.1 GntR family transcriptional regulator [Solwaraspora sp. WMMA2059]WBC20869.1 GntR family transcriptional regulator [Solwaraspora sp. WMMA2080]
MPTPHYGTPRYRRVADQLRDRITSGAIPPGALLPPEVALAKEFNVARGTIRAAINALRQDGLVTTEHGRGTYTQPAADLPNPAGLRIITNCRQDETKPCGGGDQNVTLLHREHVSTRDAIAVEATYRDVPASPHLAAMLGCEPGTLLLERRFVFKADGHAHHLTTAYNPLDLVAGTPISDPTNKPCRNDEASEFAAHGIAVTHVDLRVTARMPDRTEIEAFNFDHQTPVIAIERRIFREQEVIGITQELLSTHIELKIRIASHYQ